MVSALGVATPYVGNYARPSSAGLESQLDQYKVKLADWENCPSCKTPEGKAKIAEISDRISEIEQRLKVADAAKRTDSPAATPRLDQSPSVSVPGGGIGYGSLVVGPSLGGYLNVFA